MHILVTGSNGQLGSEIRNLAPNYPDIDFVFTDIDELDITNADAIDNYFEENEFDFLINCAAYTAVDKCESNKLIAREINVLAVKSLAIACSKYNIGMIQISTDYVYDGLNHLPYKETDFTNPQSFYGETKLEGEEMVEEFCNNGIIIRTSWLYSSFGNNFVKTVLKYTKERDLMRVVYDQIGSPTYAADLAKIIVENIDKLTYMSGVHIFNYSNEGVCSWYDFAKAIVEIKEIDCKIKPIETFEYPLPANRPSYSVLNKAKIKNELDTEIPYWKDSLKKCLKKL
jgi:dTDP-4-dehydrorhamnose reductase